MNVSDLRCQACPTNEEVEAEQRKLDARDRLLADVHPPCAICGGEVGPIAGGGLGCYRCLSHWPEERWRVPEAKREECGQGCNHCWRVREGIRPRSTLPLAQKGT